VRAAYPCAAAATACCCWHCVGLAWRRGAPEGWQRACQALLLHKASDIATMHLKGALQLALGLCVRRRRVKQATCVNI
jgi:hypothetical protein